MGDVPVCIVLMRGSGKSTVHRCLVLTPLTASRDGDPEELLECCLPPMGVLVLPQLREDGVREAV